MDKSSTRNGFFTNLVVLLAIFDSYCQMAPAAAGSARQFELGIGHTYRLENTVLLNEAAPNIGKDVGFQISADLTVASMWQNPDNANDKLFKLELLSPVLHIKSRKAPAPEGFVSHASKLEALSNGAFYIHWTSGKIHNIYVQKDEEHSMVNLKKGIASLFQFQLLDVETTEKDASGKCKVAYKTIDSQSFWKTKTDCVIGKSVPFLLHPDKVLSTNVSSLRRATYELSKDLSVLRSVMMEETHEMSVAMLQAASTSVRATQRIDLTDGAVKVKSIHAGTIEKAIIKVEETSGQVLNKMILITEQEAITCISDDCPTLHKLVEVNHDALKSDKLGTTRAAAAFVRLLNHARAATKEEFTRVLNDSKNKDILSQLADLAGAAQTREAHAAAMSIIQLESENDVELCERYFWSLSLGSHPNIDVIKDVLKLSSKENVHSEKVKETLILTVAAMTKKFRKVAGNEGHKVIGEVKTHLLDQLKKCKTEECKYKFLRSLLNLGHEETIPTILGHALTGARKTSVIAMKALKSLPPVFWGDEVIKAAIRIYYQVGKKFDSSSRTLALDILLESNPSQEVLRDIIWSLKSNDPSYELKQYLLQRLRQISGTDVEFAKRVNHIFQGECRLTNYNVFGQKGMSSAYTMMLTNSSSGLVNLISTQESSSGLVKRAVAGIQVNTASGDSQMLYSMEIFGGGLSSFVSSDEATDSSDEAEEAATAGMSITALGVELRPFVFFSGQGELMGHVWSGAGSEKTTAYQTLALLQDHWQHVPLQTGFIAQLRLVGAISFDLSGQVQLSLWNRNAHSLVEKNAGLFIKGSTNVDTSFVQSQVEFNVATEPRLNLVSDIDFYTNVAVCLQLKQPDNIVRHNVFKVERIPGSKHRLRKSKYRVSRVSGLTYALVKKNNEMCNVIFK